METHERTIRQELLARAPEAMQRGNHIKLPGIAGKEVIAVEFRYRGMLVRHEERLTLDSELSNPNAKSGFSAEVGSRSDDLVDSRPSTNLVDHCKAKLSLDCGETNYKLANLHTEVLCNLWNRNDWQKYEAHLSTKLSRKGACLGLPTSGNIGAM